LCNVRPGIQNASLASQSGFARFLFDFNRTDERAPDEFDFTILAGNFKPAGHRKIFPAGHLLN
jgi:hypothetical protein